MPPRKIVDHDPTGTARAVPVGQGRPVAKAPVDAPPPSPPPDIVTRPAVEAVESRARGETDGAGRPSVGAEAGEVREGIPAIIERAENMGAIGPEVGSGEDFASISGMQETEASYRARGLVWAPGTRSHGMRDSRGGDVPVTVSPAAPIAKALPTGAVRERNELVTDYAEETPAQHVAARPPAHAIGRPIGSPGALPSDTAAAAEDAAPTLAGRVVVALVVALIVAGILYAAKRFLARSNG